MEREQRAASRAASRAGEASRSSSRASRGGYSQAEAEEGRGYSQAERDTSDHEIEIQLQCITAASQHNVERGVAVRALPEAAMREQRGWFDELFETAVKFAEGLGEVVPPPPER